MTDSLVPAVLIVGAGPTGLTLANALTFYGVPVHIIDQKIAPSNDSKGLAINLASQYGLELIGLGQTLGQAGCHVNRLNILWHGQRLNPIDFRHLDGPLRCFITQPQATTERELLAALVKQGGTVQWETRLGAVEQRGATALVSLQAQDGSSIECNYRYVIGCEGKRSAVREAMQAQLSGSDHPMYFALGDFALDWDLPADQVSYHVYEETFFIIVPIGAGMWRVVVKHDGAMPATALQADEITQVVQHYLSDKIGAVAGKALFSDAPVWMSRASFYTRVSDRLQRGPLFLAGDAAHLFVPIGGTGMNTGMQDALNLAWKLAHRWHGTANPALLASYESERLAAIHSTAAATDYSLKLISRQVKTSAAIDELLPSMNNRTALRRTLPHRHSGLGLENPTSKSAALGTAGEGKTGQLCLGLASLRALLPAVQTPLDNAALLAVLHLESVPDTADRAALAQLAQLQQSYAHVLRLLVVGDSAKHAGAADLRHTLAQCHPALSMVSVPAKLLRLCALTAGSLLLLRPDGIVAFCGQLSELQGLHSFMQTNFLPHRKNAQETPQLQMETL